MKSVTFSLTFLFFSLFLFSPSFAKECVESRYVFDIGSGTTKMLAYKVDICKKELFGKIAYLEKKMRYVDCINSSPKPYVAPQKCLDQGVAVVESIMKTQNINCVDEKCLAVTTAWSRNIENGFDMIEMLKAINIKGFILSQKEEGYLIHKAVENKLKKDFSTFISWDIGGASSQMGVSKDNEIKIVKIPYGIDNYSLLIRDYLGITDDRALNLEESIKAEQYLKNQILKNTDFLDVVSTDKPFFGVGRVFSNAMIVELELPSKIKTEHLDTIIKYFGTHSEEEIMRKFKNVNVPKNTQMCAIYIKSLMEIAEIAEVNILDVNVNDYLLVANNYWA